LVSSFFYETYYTRLLERPQVLCINHCKPSQQDTVVVILTLVYYIVLSISCLYSRPQLIPYFADTTPELGDGLLSKGACRFE
jgi:hypothetical protein